MDDDGKGSAGESQPGLLGAALTAAAAEAAVPVDGLDPDGGAAGRGA